MKVTTLVMASEQTPNGRYVLAKAVGVDRVGIVWKAEPRDIRGFRMKGFSKASAGHFESIEFPALRKSDVGRSVRIDGNDVMFIGEGKDRDGNEIVTEKRHVNWGDRPDWGEDSRKLEGVLVSADESTRPAPSTVRFATFPRSVRNSTR